MNLVKWVEIKLLLKEIIFFIFVTYNRKSLNLNNIY